MSRFFIVTSRCPECTTLAYLRESTLRGLIQFLKCSPKDAFPKYVLCDACNLIHERKPTNFAPPRMYDTDTALQGSLYEHLFVLGFECDDKKCEPHALVLAPKMKHYWSEDDLTRENEIWRVAPEVRCANDHPLRHPLHISLFVRMTPRIQSD